MANIINDPYRSTISYTEDGSNNRQFDIDNSTVDSDTMNAYREFQANAVVHFKRVRKRATYDFKTRNKSFLELHNDLYRMGIKNNKLHLILYDRDLQGVDPYAPVLLKETQVKIYIECVINPWYFIREILRIPVDGKPIEIGGGDQYRIDRNNLACWYLFLNGIDHYQSKPRQRGKTQDVVAKFNYAYNFSNMASTALFFNKDQDQANINLYRLKCQQDMFPAYLQMKAIVTEDGKLDKGVDNTKSIRNPVNDNIIMTMAKATSKEGAQKIGRGATAALHSHDEFDFEPYQTEIIKASAFSYSTASINARANNSLAIRILSSTPGDLDTRDGSAASEFVSKMLVWDDKMLDMPIEKLRSIVNSPSYNRFVFVEHSWRQLKLTMEWYEMQCGLVSFDPETILREIDLKRIHGSSNSPFDRASLLYIMNHQREPIESIDYSKNLCPILIYEKMYINKPYILTIDPAEGLGRDNNALVVIDPTTLHTVAEYESPYITQPELVKMAIQFMDDRCRACMIIVENNKGREAINCFLESKYRDQLYYDDSKLGGQVIDKTDPYGRLKKEAYERRAWGLTTQYNRSDYFGILENLMQERKDVLKSKYLVKDICGLIRKPNGRVEAGSGLHDDVLLAYLMGVYVYNRESYEKLSQHGIFRGASHNYEDYEESGKLSQKGVMKKLIEIMDDVPENLRIMIKETMQQRTPVDDAREHFNAVDYIRSTLAASKEEVGAADNRFITQNQTVDNLNHWSQYDEMVMRGNEDYENQEFNIDDYI